jgi:hypothetical protein
MYRYLFFILFGIIIFLLYNRKETLNIGGQIEQSIEQLESMARRIAMGSNDPSQKLCSISGVGRCQLVQDKLGGSCNINALAGLVYTSASFTQEYKDFFNLTAEYIHKSRVFNEMYKCITNMKNLLPTLRSNLLSTAMSKITTPNTLLLHSLFNYNKLYLIVVESLLSDFGIDYKLNHGFLIYKISKIELSRLLEIMEEYLDMEEYQIIYTLLKNKFDVMIDDSFGLLIIDFCNNIFDIITDNSYPITTSEGLSEPYSEEYNKLWKLKIFWFWVDIFRDRIEYSYMDDRNLISFDTDIDSNRDTLNTFLLNGNKLNKYKINLYSLFNVDDIEEIEIKECTEPDNLRRLYHLSVTLKTEGGFSDDGNFTIFRPDIDTARRLYGNLYDQLDSIPLTEWDHNKKTLFLMSIDVDDMQEIIEMMEEGDENVLEMYIDAEPDKIEKTMEKINTLYPPSECATAVVVDVD